jgi:hypothetical protein
MPKRVQPQPSVLADYLSYPRQRLLQAIPALRPVPGTPTRVPFGRAPSLHLLRQRRRTASFVRRLLGYYGPVRLPALVHRRLVPLGFTPRTPFHLPRADCGVSRLPREVLSCMQGSGTAWGRPDSRHVEPGRVAFRMPLQRRHPRLFPSLVFAAASPSLQVPCQRFAGSLAVAAHDSGPA